MNRPCKLVFAGVLLWTFWGGAIPSARAAGDTPAWPAITAQTRPWTYWWWMGSAVDRTNLTRELQRYRDAGLGGVHIIPIYGAKGWESNYVQYLSPQWMELLGYTVTEAHRLGLGVDMSTGTGWCFGGPNVSARDANASVVVKTFDLATGERLTETFNRNVTQALVAFSADGKSVDLTDAIDTNGSVAFASPGGPWRVYAIAQKPSGQKVKRAAPGGAGWMLNPFYPPAMSDYLQRFTEAFAGYDGPEPRAQYQDSYEYKSDWAPDFFAEFEKRRGYRLQTELPALFGTNRNDYTARVQSDYHETLSDIMVEETEPRWIQWSHEHGFIVRYEAHGSPGNLLDLYALADVPETECFRTNRSPLVSKFASSAAHVQGRNLVSAETGTWMAEHFTGTLGEMKSLVDDLLLAGINHVFYHGTCYSPDGIPWPGWLFYASTEMNPRNAIWHDVPALNEYVARCQSVLQSGRPDNDVLLYWPIDDYWYGLEDRLAQFQVENQPLWFESQPIGRTARALWDRGYAFDYVSDRQLLAAKVADGNIQMPGGVYHVIVVPPCEYMPLETFRTLVTLAEKGATIVFENHLPADVAGANDLVKRRAEFKKAASKLSFRFQETRAGKVEVASPGRGRVFSGDLWAVLMYANVTRESMTDAGLAFIRRTFAGGRDYFIVNRGGTNFDGWIALSCAAKSLVVLDALNGRLGTVASRNGAAGATEVYLQLAAGASVILRAYAQETVQGPAWPYWRAAGPPVDITGTWNVNFISGGPVLPADFQTVRLASWTTFPDTNAQSFAGTARYAIQFDAPRLGGRPCFVDLGDVRQSARVTLNGRDYGTLITPPFRVVVDNLKPADNRLEVEVTSVSANRIRDLDRRGVPWKDFHDINFVNLDYRPFNAADWPLTDCGLLGPVTLTPVTPEPVQ